MNDNPAARLLALIEKAKAKDPKTSCRDVWHELLEVKKENAALMMERLGKAMGLAQVTVEALKEIIPTRQNTWTHWESQINTAFMVQNLHGVFGTFLDHIDSHSVALLQLSADLLQARVDTNPIDADQLLKVRQDLDAILLEVISSDQPIQVKQYLVRNLRKIIAAIEEYKLTGAFAVLDAVDATLGHAFVDKNYRSFLRDHDLGKRIQDILTAAANVVAVVIGTPQISGGLFPQLNG